MKGKGFRKQPPNKAHKRVMKESPLFMYIEVKLTKFLREERNLLSRNSDGSKHTKTQECAIIYCMSLYVNINKAQTYIHVSER